MALPERLKLPLLGVLLSLCVITFFTSYSFDLGESDLPVLRPSNVYCSIQNEVVASCHQKKDNTSRKKHNAIMSDADGDCGVLQRQAANCQVAVTEAFRHINMGGCAFENQANALCQVEWCGSNSNRQDCQEECASVRAKLEECITRNVQIYMTRYDVSSKGSSQTNPNR